MAGAGAGALGRTIGFLPTTKQANKQPEDEKRLERRSKEKESEHLLVVVVLLFVFVVFLLLGLGMVLLPLLLLLLLLFLLGATVAVLEAFQSCVWRVGIVFSKSFEPVLV